MDAVRFKESTFEFTNLLGKVELRGCSLVDTRFVATRFTGNHISFRRTSFNSSVTPFEACVFGTKGTESLFELFECTITTDTLPFRGCRIKTETFSLEASSIECSRLLLMACKCLINNSPRHLIIQSTEINLSRLACTGHFEYSNHSKCATGGDYDPPEIDLSRIMFQQMKSASFIEARLEKAIFTYSVFDTVYFMNTKWPKIKRGKGRSILFQHKSLDQGTTKKRFWHVELSYESRLKWNEIMAQYVQFKKNYEDQKDFVGASDWAYREMQCREILAEKSFYRFGLRWYRRLAQYGESYLAPFIWLMITWLVFGSIHLLNGIPKWIDGKDLNYDLFSGGTFDLGEVWSAMRFSAVAMLLQIGKSVDMKTWDGIWIYIPQLIMTFALVSLFLLALRRKFRR